jgi:hypothetical protein
MSESNIPGLIESFIVKNFLLEGLSLGFEVEVIKLQV